MVIYAYPKSLLCSKFPDWSKLKAFNPFPHNKILDQTKLKAFADDKLNVTKIMISVYDRVENIVEKRRNCFYKQFPFFPQLFSKASFPDPSKAVTVWEWVNSLTTLKKKALEKTVGKGENASNQNFSFSHSVFYSTKREIVILTMFNLSSANAFSLVTSKNLSFSKGFIEPFPK